MAEYQEHAQLFQNLSHPVRIQILDILRGGEECVCHIQSVLGKRQAYVSQQLMVLRDAGLVADRKEGLYVFYRLADPTVAEVLQLVLGPAGARMTCEDTACPHCSSAEEAESASLSANV
jgi:DNA-binding transcriptional ArsR family regulator